MCYSHAVVLAGFCGYLQRRQVWGLEKAEIRRILANNDASPQQQTLSSVALAVECFDNTDQIDVILRKCKQSLFLLLSIGPQLKGSPHPAGHQLRKRATRVEQIGLGLPDRSAVAVLRDESSTHERC